VKAFLGIALVLVTTAASVYLIFIDPWLVDSQSESYAATQSCVDDDPSLARHAPTSATRRAFARCIYRIRTNRWSSLVGWDLREIGRPFLDSNAT
jgi:hypothetical protein